MTETEARPVSRGEYSEGISIETSKVVQGMSLVFSGAMTMLEAIHPKISLQPAELMCLITGDREGLAKLAEMRKEEAAKATQGEPEAETKEETDETENAGAGPVDIPADDSDAAVSDAPLGDTPGDVTQESTQSTDQQEPPKPAEPANATKPAKAKATAVTQDDITKIIVQKIKANRSNNEKIGQLLKNYGAARVSDLPASNYEAFITELASI